MMEKIKKYALLFVLLVLPYLMYNYIAKGENNFVKLAVIGEDDHKIPAFSFTNQDSVTITNADGTIYQTSEVTLTNEFKDILALTLFAQFKDNSNNNVSYSDVASGNSPTVTIASAAYTGKTFFPGILIRDDQDADDNVAEINFGNPSFSISSGNTDGLYGNFEYAVPSGYYALCTKRLATYG